MDPSPSPASRGRRRWPKVVGLLLVLLLAVLTLGWFLAPGIVAGRTEAAIEATLAVDATVEDVSLSLGGDAGIGSVRLVDPEGREVATISGLTAHVGLGALLRGAVDGKASVGKVELFVYQEPDGSWSTERLPRREGDGGDVPPDEAPRAGGSGLPSIDLAFLAPAIELTLVPSEGQPRMLAAELAATMRGGDVVALQSLHLESDFLRGDVEGRVENLSGWLEDPASPLLLRGVAADLRYVPDGLRDLLAPFVALDLEGAEEEPLQLTRLEGDVTAFSPPDTLLRGLSGDLTAGVGRLTVARFTAQGDVAATLAAGRLTLTSDLDLNGGAFDLRADVDLAGLWSADGARDTTFSVDLDDVGIGAEFAPLLAPLHPMLAANDALARGGLEGSLDATVSFAIPAPLELGELQEDPSLFPLDSLSAEGSLGLTAALRDLPLVAALGEALGVDLAQGARLDRFAFAIDDGRVAYARPWTWTIDGLETSFTGSVGLDRTLDLTWHIPIDARLAEKSALLARLQGRRLSLPVTGSLLSPRLGLEGALRDLAGDALGEELRKRLEDLDLLGGDLGDLTGGDLDGVLDDIQKQLGRGGDDPAGDAAGSNDPAVLLREADRLWNAGDKASAQPLYRRIEKEFSLSPAYLLNRRRVKDRADWKP